MREFESDSGLNPMPVSELDWLLDSMETAVGRFDANGYLVQHNTAFSHVWPRYELGVNLPYSHLLAELVTRHPEAKTEWQYIQAWMKNPQATVSLQLTLRNKTRQEWRMRPATAGGFWCLIQLLEATGEVPESLEDWLSLTHKHDLQTRAAQELVKTLEQARELSALKSRIITMISHEFRTPLTQIQSAVELLRYLDLKGVEQDEIFEQVYQGIRAITNRMDDVLQVRRQRDEHPIPPCRVSVDIVALCQVELETMSRERDRPIQLKSQLNPQEQYISTDSEMMQQIVYHLLSNAIQYSMADSPIYVELEREGDRLILRVRDHGIGILAEDMPHLFDFFYRGGNIGSVPGIGLGLSILNYYVQLLAGEVTVESQPDKGSCFTVSLPIDPKLPA